MRGISFGAEASASVWTPLAIANRLVIWDVNYGMCSDAGMTPAVANDPIYDWVARYPLDGSIRFRQATLALRPILKVGANGMRYVTFASGQYMQCPSGTAGFFTANHADCSLFALCKRTATGSYMQMFSSDNNGGIAGTCLAYDPSNAYVGYGNSYRNMVGDTSVWFRYSSKFLWDGTKNVGTPFYNGTAAPNVSSGAENTTTASNGELAIGSRTGGFNPFTGHIAGWLGATSPYMSPGDLSLLDAIQATLAPT